MSSIWASLFLVVSGAVVGKALDFFVDFIKGRKPRIDYSTDDGIPVEAEDKKYLCAYDLAISNGSKKKAEELTFHLRAGDLLKIVRVEKPPGLEYSSIEKDGSIELSLSYLKRGDSLRIRAVAESKYVPPGPLRVSFSSPHDIIGTRIQRVEGGSSRTLTFPFIIAGCSAGFMVLIGSLVFAKKPVANQVEERVLKFQPDRRDLVISAASAAGLPHVAELSLVAADPKFYNEGDLAYSLAVASNKPEEVDKYRRLISLTLGADTDMAPESQANLFYSLGRLDLLLQDEKSAVADFRNSIGKSRATVEAQAKADPETQRYLRDKGLL